MAAFTLVAYLGLESGGYDVLVHGQAGVATWWLVLVGLLTGLLPLAAPRRSGWLALAFLGALAAWCALSLLWTESAGSSWLETARLAAYAGFLALGLCLVRDDRSARALLAGALSAVVLLALVALAARLFPGPFPETGSAVLFDPGESARLSFPVNYWNALAALAVMALPVALGLSATAASALGRALPVAALPPLILAGYLTFSRAAIVFAVIGLLVYLVLAHKRLASIAALALAAVGAGILIALAEASDGGAGGGVLALLAVLLVSGVAGAAYAKAAAALERRGSELPVPSRVAALRLLAVGVALVVAVGLVTGAPGAVSRVWEGFKSPSLGLEQDSTGSARLGEISGTGRYQYWQVALDQAGSAPLAGTGAGTYELWWLRERTFNTFVQSAHSLYLEALGGLGVVGLALLLGFVAAVLVGGLARVRASAGRARTVFAGAFAGCLAFALWAAIDWLWQVGVVAALFLLLAAALIGAPAGADRGLAGVRRLVGAAAALLALVAIAIPLVSTAQLRASRSSAEQGRFDQALAEARRAAAVMPGSAPARLQQALVHDRRGEMVEAVLAARSATALEPGNWQNWLVLARVEARNGDRAAAGRARARAERLNPLSPQFQRQ